MISGMAATGAQTRKCYGQICPVARALDVVGDRWTLLIVRELLGGPARFVELYEGLPGIAKNLLTERLRRLEGDGVVRRVAGTHATYALTEVGAAIRPAVDAIGMWGVKVPRVAEPVHDRSLRAVAVALHSFLIRAGDALPTERVVVELQVDGGALEIVLGPQPTVTARPTTDAQARVRVPKAAVSDYLAGRAFDKRAFELISGDRDARAALLRAMAAMMG